MMSRAHTELLEATCRTFPRALLQGVILHADDVGSKPRHYLGPEYCPQCQDVIAAIRQRFHEARERLVMMRVRG